MFRFIRRARFSSTATSTSLTERIHIDSISSHVKAAEYAVRGPIVARAADIQTQINSGKHNFKFNRTIQCNIGNPQSLEQKPLSYIREVLALTINPSLIKDCASAFPAEAIARAKNYLGRIPGVGAYTESQGMQAVRDEICQFLLERDGVKGELGNIFVTNGASDGVRLCFQTVIRAGANFKDGILTPIPQYPLYSALTTLLEGHLVPYYLEESRGWSCTVDNLSKALADASAKKICTRGLVVINPGNPTGQVLDVDSMREIVRWCRQNNICLMADEVYQENVYRPGAKFTSFRKIAFELKAFEGENPLQLISFHSVSKGFMGECGLRGGYFEMLGLPADVKQEIYKLASISLCSNTIGQVTTGLMVQPPKEGESWYGTYQKERSAILESLARRAKMLSKALNALEGVSCTSIDGAMYAFPTVHLPTKAVEAAKSAKIEPDVLYCQQLLEETGIVVVPGSGFQQAPGTYHFRTTILPPEDKMEDVVRLLGEFHANFLKKYT
jgi:alanine transaminase